jgi:hypothetical protein
LTSTSSRAGASFKRFGFTAAGSMTFIGGNDSERGRTEYGDDVLRAARRRLPGRGSAQHTADGGEGTDRCHADISHHCELTYEPVALGSQP